MDDLIRREAVIDALNDCIDIKGYAYKELHDAIMEIPTERIANETDNRINGSK